MTKYKRLHLSSSLTLIPPTKLEEHKDHPDFKNPIHINIYQISNLWQLCKLAYKVISAPIWFYMYKTRIVLLHYTKACSYSLPSSNVKHKGIVLHYYQEGIWKVHYIIFTDYYIKISMCINMSAQFQVCLKCVLMGFDNNCDF